MNFLVKSIFLSIFFISSIFASPLELTKEEKDYLESKPYLTFMNQDKFQPFSFEKDGKVFGYSPDMLRLMGKALNKEVRFIKNKNWTEQIKMLKEGQIDAFSYMAKNLKREEFIEFSSEPFFNFSIGFAINKRFNISSMDDLKDKKVAVVNNSFLHDHLNKNFPHIELILTNSVEQSLDMIAQQKADTTLDNVNTLNYFIEQAWLSQLKVLHVDDLGLPFINRLYMAVLKENKILMGILEKTRTSLDQKDLDKLKDKWLHINRDKKDFGFTKEEKEYLAQKSIWKVQSSSSLPPFNFREDDKAYGYTVDYMRLMGKYLGVEIQFVGNATWREQLNMLKNGSLDIMPHIAINEERKKFIDYTDFNHIEYSIGFTLRNDLNIKSFNELKDKVIAVSNKSFLHTYLKKKFPDVSLLLTKTTDKGMEALINGRADAVIGNFPSLEYHIQKNWLSGVKTVILNDLGLSQRVKLPMGVKKGNKLLKSILEKAESKIPHSEIIKLKDKWFNVKKTITETTTSLDAKELEYLENKKIIKMCVLPNWLPFEQIDENTKHKGIGADIMKKVSAYIGTPIELLPTKEWSKSLQNLRDRKCDILPVAMDVPSRRDSMNFTKPYVAEPFVVATKTDKLFIKNESELSNKKIGIVKSYAFVDVLKEKNPDIQIVEVLNTKEGLEMVQNGELYGYIDTMPTVGYFIQKHSMFDLKIAGKLPFDITLSVASRNDEPELNAIMQKALDTISKDEIRTIVGKWISIKVSQEFDYRLLWQISGVFIFIILGFTYWNRSVSNINKKLWVAHEEIKEQQKMVDRYVLILATDTKGVITNVNQAYCDVIGFSKDELMGNTHSIMKHPNMQKEIFDDMWENILVNKAWQGEIKNLSKTGKTIWFNMNVEPIYKEGIKVGYRSISENITDKKRIEELSITDNLTGLFNRLKLDEILNMKIHEYERYHKTFSVVILDVDNFKSINDTYGHDVGDKVLIKLSNVLHSNMRATDYVGRWGGEEFVVICENTNIDGAYVLAEHLRKAVEETVFDVIGHRTISLGVAQIQENDSISSIFKKVDLALYEAKKTGKNKTIIHKDS